jgi:hypothetical protein
MGLRRKWHNLLNVLQVPPNGWRYPLVGGTRQRHFIGTNLKPRKLLENAQTPTSRVHAVLGGVSWMHAQLAIGFNLDNAIKARSYVVVILFVISSIKSARSQN